MDKKWKMWFWYYEFPYMEIKTMKYNFESRLTILANRNNYKLRLS